MKHIMELKTKNVTTHNGIDMKEIAMRERMYLDAKKENCRATNQEICESSDR